MMLGLTWVMVRDVGCLLEEEVFRLVFFLGGGGGTGVETSFGDSEVCRGFEGVMCVRFIWVRFEVS